MLSNLLKSNDTVVISTGNVLNVNELRKKAGQKPTEEFIDCLKSTLSDADVQENINTNQHLITRKNNDLQEKIQEHERNDIKIGVKIFLNKYSENYLCEAIDKLFETLNVTFLDNLILAYHPRAGEHIGVNGDEPHTNGDVKEGVIEWGVGTESALLNLNKLWNNLEKYALEKKIGQLGIADLDVETLIHLYNNTSVHPTIAQINLAACCVVPPQLQEFCGQNDIQLLTHSDPQEILSKPALVDLQLNHHHSAWATRYQVHIKCRGVLAAKGFIASFEPNSL